MSDIDEIEIEQHILELYQRGFNAGYEIEKENPLLAKHLFEEESPNDDNAYFRGMKAGSQEMKLERTVARIEKDRSDREAEKHEKQAREQRRRDFGLDFTG